MKLNHFQALPSRVTQFLSTKLLMTSAVSSSLRPYQISRPSASPCLVCGPEIKVTFFSQSGFCTGDYNWSNALGTINPAILDCNFFFL